MYSLINKNNLLIFSGLMGASILASNYLYENKDDKKNKDKKNKDKKLSLEHVKKEIMDNYDYGNFVEIDKNISCDNENIQKVIDSKKEGYNIYINSIYDYLEDKKNNENTKNFSDFLQKYWNSDYNIMINSNNQDSSSKRNYKEWKDIFNKIYKNI